MENNTSTVLKPSRGSAGFPTPQIYQRQSRFEVLWRIWIVDCFRDEHPASVESGKAMTEAFEYAVSLQQQFVDYSQLLALPSFDNKRTLEEELISNGINMAAVPEIDLEIAKNNLAQSLKAIPRIIGLSDILDHSSPLLSEYVDFKTQGEAAGRVNETLNSGVSRLVREISRPIRSSLAVEVDGLITLILCTRNLFSTHQGLLGLGPQHLRDGDEVWLMKEADVPIILRRLDEEHYEVVSEAYVHGIMHGELVANLSNVDVKTIILV
jgi:hypothetical protein